MLSTTTRRVSAGFQPICQSKHQVLAAFMDLRFGGGGEMIALIGSEMGLFTVARRSGGRVENHGISVCKDCN